MKIKIDNHKVFDLIQDVEKGFSFCHMSVPFIREFLKKSGLDSNIINDIIAKGRTLARSRLGSL